MTRKIVTNNRKKNNKVTVYLSDATRDYLIREATKPGMNRSLVVQDALLLREGNAVETINKGG
jgi:hypothetical protein